MAGFKRQALVDDTAEAATVSLCDLSNRRATVFCLCQRCGHAAMVDAGQLVGQLGPDMPVAEVGTRMRCRGCGSKDVATQPGWTAAVAGEGLTAGGLAAAS